MTAQTSPFAAIARLFYDLRSDVRAAATVEFVLIAPCLFMLMALIVFAGEGFEVQRKVTMTMRTLTDLVTQQCDVGPTATGYASPCPSSTYTYSQIVGAASLVMVPYSASAMTFTVAEIQTNSSSSGAGTLVWCEYTSGGSSLCPGGSATAGGSASFPSNLSSAPDVVFGEVQYTYYPVGIWFQGISLTLSDSIYMLPRINTTVACSGC